MKWHTARYVRAHQFKVVFQAPGSKHANSQPKQIGEFKFFISSQNFRIIIFSIELPSKSSCLIQKTIRAHNIIRNGRELLTRELAA